MESSPDLRERVVAELGRRMGDLPAVSKQSGVPYDTVLRIKNCEGDVLYSNIRKLADYFGYDVVSADQAAAQAPG
jgi:hypothetical protein